MNDGEIINCKQESFSAISNKKAFFLYLKKHFQVLFLYKKKYQQNIIKKRRCVTKKSMRVLSKSFRRINKQKM